MLFLYIDSSFYLSNGKVDGSFVAGVEIGVCVCMYVPSGKSRFDIRTPNVLLFYENWCVFEVASLNIKDVRRVCRETLVH